MRAAGLFFSYPKGGDIVLTCYALHPFNFMLGFAWHKDEQEIEVFIGLFAITYCWSE